MTERTHEKTPDWLLILVALICGFIIGITAGSCLMKKETTEAYRKQAIERGFGEYNAQTGEWQWVKGNRYGGKSDPEND